MFWDQYIALLEWISVLSGRIQQVIVNREKSFVPTVFSGVPQGTALVTLLFLCFVNHQKHM